MKRRSVLVAVATALLGLATLIAIPNLVQIRAAARDGDTMRNMRAVQVSMDAFGDAHSGQYPYSALDLAPYLRAPLVDPWTGRTMTVVFRSGPPVASEELARGAVIVFRPDPTGYEIFGVGREKRLLALVLLGGPQQPSR